MRIIEKTEMKRLPGSFSCVFQLKKTNYTKIINWIGANNAIFEHCDNNSFHDNTTYIRAVLTDEQLTMLALTFAE